MKQAPVASAALVATALELEGIARAGGMPASLVGSAALIVAITGYAVGVLAVLALLLASVGRVASTAAGRWAPALRPRVARALALLAFMGGLAGHIIDTTYYVRLYPMIHLALGLSTLALLLAAAWLAASPGRRPSVASTAAGRVASAAAGGLGVWGLMALAPVGLGVGYGTLELREDAKAALLAHGSAVAHVARQVATARAPWGPCEIPTVTRAEQSLPPGQTSPPAGARPLAPGANLVLISVDALRAEMVTGEGDGQAPMPAALELARGATVFLRAYSAASWTFPAVYSLMTSRPPMNVAWTYTGIIEGEKVVPLGPPMTWPRPWSAGGVPTPMDDRHPTLAEALAGAGYITAAFPVHENLLSVFGVSRGFTVYDNQVWKQLNRSGGRVTGDRVTDLAVAFLERAQGRPFYLWVHLYDPHAPYVVPPGETAAGSGAKDRYRAEVSFTDKQVRRLLDALGTLGLARSTVVALVADHGEEFGDHGGGFHGTTLYDEQIRVPFILRVPGLGPAQIEAPVSLVDLAPTLLDLLGHTPPPTFLGRSLVPLLLGQGQPPHPIMIENVRKGYQEQFGLVSGPHKLIWDRRAGYRELYDLSRDPWEQANLVVAEPGVADALTAELCGRLGATDVLAVQPHTPSPP